MSAPGLGCVKTLDLQERLDDLTRRKTELEALFTPAHPPLPRLHPRLADVYRQKVEQLHDALKQSEAREEAMEIMRDLLEKVVVRNSEIGFEIELFGELANMLALSGAPKTAEFDCSVTMVAGEGFEPPTLGL